MRAEEVRGPIAQLAHPETNGRRRNVPGSKRTLSMISMKSFVFSSDNARTFACSPFDEKGN